jgi:exosortase family protein XrtM
MRFALKVVIVFALLTGGFEASRGTAFEHLVVVKGILIPTTSLLNALTPLERVTLIGRTITSPDGSGLRVTRGCEGIEMFLLLSAAILAYPATLQRRVRGLLLGSALAYVLSLARLILLHYVLRYSPNAWQALHGLVLPLAPVVLMMLYFLLWSEPAAGESPNAPTRARPAAIATNGP